MTFWGPLILAVLQTINLLLGSKQDRDLIDTGYQKRIAEEAAKILKGNQYAKQAMERINSMSADDVDKLLQQLEPKN